MPQDTKLIVGLGNPGREYQATRHNLGFMAVEALARDARAVFKKSRHAAALTAEVTEPGDARVILALPQTFMNNSGAAVAALMKFYKLMPADVLVVCDDLRLAVGQLRLRTEGSDGGHNGLKSVEAHLGVRTYARLKLGIGTPEGPDDQTDFVLGRFSAGEMNKLEDVLKSACACCRLWLAGDTAGAMTRYNKRKDNE